MERRTDACEDEIPLLERTPLLLYGGCNRNVHRDATQSVETCQNGTVAFSNASGTRSTGLFDAKIANDVDAWNFVCAFGIDRPRGRSVSKISLFCSVFFFFSSARASAGTRLRARSPSRSLPAPKARTAAGAEKKTKKKKKERTWG